MAYLSAQWAMLVVLAKLGTPEMVGQFALGLAITAPVVMFSNLELRAVQATDATRRYRFGDYLALRLIGTALALVVILGIVFVTGYRGETALVILVVGLAKAFESISDLFYGLFLQRERVDCMAKSMLLKAPLSLIGLTLGVYLTHSVVVGVVALALVWALLLIGYDVRTGARILRASYPASPDLRPGDADSDTKLRPYWTGKRLRQLGQAALPLGIVGVLINLYPNIPRYFVEGYLGSHALGIFAAMAYTTVAGIKLVDSLAQTVGPRLAGYHAAGNETIYRIVAFRTVGIGLLLGAAGVLVVLFAGSEILTLMYGPEYAAYPDVFLLLMVAAAIDCMTSFQYWAITAARRFASQMPLYALVACASAAACFWLVPTAGLRGAAIACVIAAAVRWCGGLVIIVHILHTLRRRASSEAGIDKGYGP
jgi:O-antigen/teichoic acid export membrane protein